MGVWVNPRACYAFLVAQMVKNLPAMQETHVPSLGWEDPLEKEWLPTPVFLPGKFMDRGAWWATSMGFTKSQTRLNDQARVKHRAWYTE